MVDRFKREGAPANWYDDAYSQRPEYAKHYSESVYYPVWCVIVEKLQAAGSRDILEVGCGAGQLAALVRDSIGLGYVGFDFSAQAVQMARQHSPGTRFEVADALKTDLFECVQYDCVVCTEVLEHIVEDLDVIKRVPVGKRVIATVPNRDSDTHVRFFKTSEEVAKRYAHLFTTGMTVSEILVHREGSSIFVLTGVRA